MQAPLTRQHAAALAARRPGTVTGVIRSFAGQPLPGACVTAFGPAGTGTARAGRRVLGAVQLRLRFLRLRHSVVARCRHGRGGNSDHRAGGAVTTGIDAALAK